MGGLLSLRLDDDPEGIAYSGGKHAAEKPFQAVLLTEGPGLVLTCRGLCLLGDKTASFCFCWLLADSRLLRLLRGGNEVLETGDFRFAIGGFGGDPESNVDCSAAGLQISFSNFSTTLRPNPLSFWCWLGDIICPCARSCSCLL